MGTGAGERVWGSASIGRGTGPGKTRGHPDGSSQGLTTESSRTCSAEGGCVWLRLAGGAGGGRSWGGDEPGGDEPSPRRAGWRAAWLCSATAPSTASRTRAAACPCMPPRLRPT